MTQHIEIANNRALGKRSMGQLFDKSELPKVPRAARREPNTVLVAPRRSAQVVGSVREAPADLALRAPVGYVRLEALDSPNWKKQLSDFLHIYGRTRSGNFNKPTGEETFRNRKDILFSTFTALMKDKQLKTLSQIRPRTMPRMFELWEAKGISDRAQINYYNQVRWFWRVCGIEIEPIASFAKRPGQFTINRNATKDKSWSGNGIDFDDVIEKIREHDPIAARLFETMKAYGLRLKEALCLRPHESDVGTGLRVFRGTKTGRARQLEFSEFGETNFRSVLDSLKGSVPEENHLAWSHLSLKQAKRRMYTVCERFGITKAVLGVSPHGLRHEFSIEYLEKLTGVQAPVRGGIAINYKELAEARRTITRALGHNRTEITGAYYGSFVTHEREQLRHFRAAWEALEVPLREIGALLMETGIDNLFWIGAKALGAKNSSSYEFVLPPCIDPHTAMKVSNEIADMVLSATGVDCITLAWEAMPSAKQALWEAEGIPLFQAVSPLDYMKDRLLAQRAARVKPAKEVPQKTEEAP